jgi:hypothetical protein
VISSKSLKQGSLDPRFAAMLGCTDEPENINQPAQNALGQILGGVDSHETSNLTYGTTAFFMVALPASIKEN